MKILWFAWFRTRVGTAEESVTPPASVTDVRALVAWLKTRSPGHAEALKDESVVRVAVNREFAKWDQAVKPGDEIALFPPVTGG